MGVCLYVRLKQEVPGVDPAATDGKLLAKAIDVLDRAAGKLGIRKLSDFYSVSQKQAMAEFSETELSDEEYEALADDHVWWPAAEGLKSVSTLLAWAEQHQDKLNRPEDVIADLRDFRAALEAANGAGVEFNIAVSA